ncbi:MAG: hypothetical protein JWM39_635 [Parcubacteria group bacterium]|nr:hypothetical protein [Parcubacteria group bacterium]
MEAIMARCFYVMHVHNEKANRRYSFWRRDSGLSAPSPLHTSVCLANEYLFTIHKIEHFLESANYRGEEDGDIYMYLSNLDPLTDPCSPYVEIKDNYPTFSKYLREHKWEKIV